jgi:hypothetical protein
MNDSIGCPNELNSGVSPTVPPPTSKRPGARTPGACTIRLMAPLRLVGVSSSVSFVNCVLADVAVTSTTGAAPETVNVSESAPSFSVTSSRTVAPRSSRTASWRIVVKPSSVYNTA